MPTNWLALVDGDVFGGNLLSFDPAVHILTFDDQSIPASSLRVYTLDGLSTSISFGGKTVILDVAPWELGSGNINFVGVGDFFFGGNTFGGPLEDDAPNSFGGTAGDDFLAGGGGNDSLS